jgi:predicted Zn-dependent peptidase
VAWVIEQEAQRTQILVGGLAPSLDHPDHARQGALDDPGRRHGRTRLFVELRDKSALAYTAASYYDPVHETGALILTSGTAPECGAGRARADARDRAGSRRAGAGR